MNPLSPQAIMNSSANFNPSHSKSWLINSTNVTPSNKRNNNTNKSNVLTNKALAYLNAKKSNLRLYEEQ